MQVGLVRRALALIATQGSERGEPRRSPVARYLDGARFGREMARIFRRFPLALCPSATLARPGDLFAIDVAGVLLLLDEDFALGVSQQSTLASGANESLPFGSTEWCSSRFHGDVEALLAP